jgi:hypothetical protein
MYPRRQEGICPLSSSRKLLGQKHRRFPFPFLDEFTRNVCNHQHRRIVQELGIVSEIEKCLGKMTQTIFGEFHGITLTFNNQKSRSKRAAFLVIKSQRTNQPTIG